MSVSALIPTDVPPLNDVLLELKTVLSGKFAAVDFKVEICPDLSNCRLPLIGSELCLLTPSGSEGPKDGIVVQGFQLTTKGKPAMGIRMVLGSEIFANTDWKPIVRQSVQKLSGQSTNWEFLCIDLNGNTAELSLLNHPTPTSGRQNSTIWLFPITKMNIGTKNDEQKPKKKIIRRIVKGTNADGTPKKTLVSTKTVLTNGQTVVKKRIVDKSSPKENSPDIIREVLEDLSTVTYVVRMGQPDGQMIPNGNMDGIPHGNSETPNGIPNGNVPKSNGLPNGHPIEPIPNGHPQPNGIPNGIQSVSPIEETKKPQINGIHPNEESTKPNGSSQNIPNGAETKTESPKESSNIPKEPNEIPKPKEAEQMQVFVIIFKPFFRIPKAPELAIVNETVDTKRNLPPIPSEITYIETPPPARKSFDSFSFAASTTIVKEDAAPPKTEEPKTEEPKAEETKKEEPKKEELKKIDQKEECLPSTSATIIRSTPEKADRTVRGMAEVPVVALQLVLSTFSYQELCRLRAVHPHWDELCGQILNSGYYELIHKADLLMTECQRRVLTEKHLQRPLQVLTNLQVHILNPVDMLRAAMDEGVLCFPYGLILDKSFDLIERVERVMSLSEDDGDEIPLVWERLAQYSRQAQTHYRRVVEPEVEKRMTEVYKLSAQQRLQRLDSFLVETTVNKLEKVTEQASSELKWEVEQLKSQNSQLKKDNRTLKQTCVRLEGRIEALENKFRTMARLLQ